MSNRVKHEDENEIVDTEPISRILFCPSMVFNGRVSPTAFELEDLEHGPEGYVSLFLLNVFKPTKENCAKIRARKKEDALYGFAKSVVNKCKSLSFDGITLLFKRHDKKTAGHIGLHYSKDNKSIKGKCTDPSFIIMTSLIAKQFQAIQFTS